MPVLFVRNICNRLFLLEIFTIPLSTARLRPEHFVRGGAVRLFLMCAFLQSGDKVLHIFVTFQHFSNLFNRMDDGTVVASAKGPAQFGIREAQMATADVHGGLPGHDQPRVASRARDVGGGGIAAACGLGQDLFVAGMAGLHRSRTGQTFQIVQAGMPGGIIFPGGLDPEQQGTQAARRAMRRRCARGRSRAFSRQHCCR